MESGDVGRHYGLKRLIAYREGRLPAAESEKVEEHLSLCPRCTNLLLELRDFEAAVASGETGPESLRQEDWDALAQRLPALPALSALPAKTPAIRPVPSTASEERPGEPRRFVSVALAAVLLFAVLGLTAWAAFTIVQERRQLASLERRLKERDAAVTALQRSLAEARRQLEAARRQIQDLEKDRTGGKAPEKPGPAVMALREIEVSVAPRYVLRGHEASAVPVLRAGEVSSVRASPDHRIAVAIDLAGHPASEEYRFELIDSKGKALWSGRRLGASVLGDDGTSVSIRGLGPGLYRLRIKADGGTPVAEYPIRIEP